MQVKLQELIQRLLSGTLAGIFRWADTAEDGIYQLLLDEGFVRIYRLAVLEGEYLIFFTVSSRDEIILCDVSVPGKESNPLVELYNFVNDHRWDDLDDLLAEVRTKVGAEICHGR